MVRNRHATLKGKSTQMLFNSFIFILCFVPIAFAAYHLLNHFHLTTAAKASLILSSLFFYGWWNIKYVPLILCSIGVNFTIASMLQSAENKWLFNKKTIFIAGLAFNIGLLGYFKYCDFFISNFNALTGEGVPLMHLALPLGISFFTLQQITLLIDTYEKLVKPKGFLNYALFVLFFPQLVAGPIVHHKQMMPQFESLRSKVVNHRNFACGIFIFSIGLLKKTVFADSFSPVVRNAFDTLPSLSLVEAWTASLSYTFQMYYDFSGYSDMAIGLALLFNINLPINFNSPYKAKSLIEYWNRWHITLSLFINAYLYTPLARLLGFSFTRILLALMAAMLISGLWHGASWIFIFWGLLHGAGICVNHVWNRGQRTLPFWLAWFLTFNFVNISLVFFRSHSFADALKVLKGMAGFNTILPDGFVLADAITLRMLQLPIYRSMAFSDAAISVVLAAISIPLLFFCRNAMELRKELKPDLKHFLWIVGCLSISFLFMNSFAEKEFLYFEF